MVNETEVTSRNSFIVNVFALGSEKKFKKMTKGPRLDLLYKNNPIAENMF